jgi:hypothetical protein
MPASTLPSGRKLGNRKRSYDSKRLFFNHYLDRKAVVPPSVALDMSVAPLIVANPWIMTSMLCNGPSPSNPPQIPDGIGCCWWAAAARRAATAAASVGKLLWTSEADMIKAVLQGYASTGFDINNATATDQGTDPTEGDAYMKSTGLLCSDGTYVKVATTLSVNPQDWNEVMLAFQVSAGNLRIGVNFPQAWETAAVWDQTSSPSAGGHEIPGYSNLKVTPAGIWIRSWGEGRILTSAGLSQNGQDVSIDVTLDQLGPGGINIAGFDNAAVIADIQVTP